MKISLVQILLLCAFFGVSWANDLSAQELLNQRLSLDLKEKKMKMVLKEIEKSADVHFSYSPQVIESGRMVSITVKDATLGEVLKQLLTPLQISYDVTGKQIVLSYAPQMLKPTKENNPGSSAPIDKSINGRVTDDKGDALPGVSIMIKGRTQGTTTDNDGYYKLTVPDGPVSLIFSFVGYTSQEVAADKSSIDIQLTADIKSLTEMVVVGYGVQKKTSVTAAVSTLKGEEVGDIPITNLSNSLGGRLSGVIVKQGSGEPGRDGSSIFIRGISSTGANQPLLIVDNIPRNFQHLDPNTIESFTILKDAAAVAPYGVAGANGVVLVTTKRGKKGTPSLTYNGYVGFQNPTVLPDYASAHQFGLLKNAAAESAGLPKPYTDEELQKFIDGSDTDKYPNHDVRKELIARNAVITTHNIELSGGAERVSYYASVGYQHQAGMWHATNNNRYNLALNLDANVTNSTKISLNLNGRVQKSLYPSINTARIFELLHYAHPQNGPLFFSNGMNGSYVTGSILNSGYQRDNTTSIYTQLSIEQQIPFIEGLSLKGTIAYDPTTEMSKLWTLPVHLASINTSQKPYVITDGIFGQTKPSLNMSTAKNHQLTYQAGLNYNRSFGKNNIGVLGLFEAKANEFMTLAATRRNYNLAIDEINMGSSSNADMTTSGTSSSARQVGVVYRVTYDYADKYLLEASGRYDGSYFFSPEQRFGFFPAFSAGWRLSEEPFLKGKVRWLDNLKVRASYGEVGALAGSPFQYLSTYNVVGPAYVIGGGAVQAVRERNQANPNITWERARKTDIGLEGTLWRGLLNFEVDYFYEKRSNMLVNPDVVLPLEYGIGLSQVNDGIMDNRGFDLSLGSNYRVSNDLQISLSGNLTYAKNKVLQVFETATTFNNPNRRLTGRPLGTQFGFHSLGFFQVEDFDDAGALKPGIAVQPWGKVQPGDIRYEDLDGDGRINDNDITTIGDPVASPRIIYGISPGVKYKNFNLDMLFQGAGKTNFYYDLDAGWAFFNGMGAFANHMDYWTPENRNASNPRITAAPTTNNTQRSSFWMGNAKYLRLKTVTFSYNIPAAVTKKIRTQSARVYVSAQNLFTWTPLRNFDPEIGNNLGRGYPQQKVTSIGLNITF
ncbi:MULTISPECIES: TonB-dependent receptor [Dyadobacter]|uniref:TonB-dependent receptor n=1 Tax=Dyadobacter chenhuakuii TaxID=2909339 RepID=A0A9X1QCC9_9BACT|nr:MULTISPECIES: TonB-dependent receptor [Dyadobacter]MCE7070024.1 TonB-dependent receptor [Dyadobacter sp. CY327]MCF2497224.1 TonB-dependent receptor [Dyadobacter chenhuakuii]MCF2517010.1 TonB-dependent receptor [Dyadobacter sp. CY351]